MKYVMDTSSFLEGSFDRAYEMGLEYFDPIWEIIDSKIRDSTIISPYIVLKELEPKADDVYNGPKREKIFYSSYLLKKFK